MATVADLPGQLNLSIYQGATFAVALTWTADGVPVNLTGYTASMKIVDGQTTVTTLTSGSGITLGGTAGTIAISIPASTTAGFSPANCEYDLKLTSPGGVVTCLVAGLIPIRKGVN